MLLALLFRSVDNNTYLTTTSSQWTPTGSNIFYNTGKVFIGATSDNGTGALLQGTGNIYSSGSILAAANMRVADNQVFLLEQSI